jgi:hypothetical protein
LAIARAFSDYCWALSGDLVQRTMVEAVRYVSGYSRIHCRERSAVKGKGLKMDVSIVASTSCLALRSYHNFIGGSPLSFEWLNVLASKVIVRINGRAGSHYWGFLDATRGLAVSGSVSAARRKS